MQLSAAHLKSLWSDICIQCLDGERFWDSSRPGSQFVNPTKSSLGNHSHCAWWPRSEPASQNVLLYGSFKNLQDVWAVLQDEMPKKVDRMWRWIRPLHECTCAHFTSLTRPYCAVFPADPKRFKLCARQRTVGRSSHGGTLSTFSYYRQCVFPTPKENLVWPERTVSVLREDNVCIIAAFKIKLNVFLIPDKFI